MVRTLAIASVILVVAVGARADRVIVVDGRTFAGTVTVQDQTVLIKMAYGTLVLPKKQVLRIEFGDTPAVELGRKLAAIPDDDPDALFSVAEWASENSLQREARQIYARILELDGNHALARRKLGFVKIDDRWRGFEQSLELAKSKLEAGRYKQLTEEILPALEAAANDDKKKLLEVRELLGCAQLRVGQFERAGRTFANLAQQADGAKAVRYGAIAEIVGENDDGMYVVMEPYPPTAGLLNADKPAPRAGPATLTEPWVLDAALRHRAKRQIEIGRKLMDAARKAETGDPNVAKAKYTLAIKAFDRADALVPDISRSYRVEIARRRITAIRRNVDADAQKFDAALTKFGLKDVPPKIYREMLVRLIHHLDNVREDLLEILNVAGSYPRELVLEIGWAKADLDKIQKIRNDLTSELNHEK